MPEALGEKKKLCGVYAVYIHSSVDDILHELLSRIMWGF